VAGAAAVEVVLDVEVLVEPVPVDEVEPVVVPVALVVLPVVVVAAFFLAAAVVV
jgi:hypothetical protein